MMTPALVDAAVAQARELERVIKARVSDETDVARQRRALAVFRHAHALRIALEDWQDHQQA